MDIPKMNIRFELTEDGKGVFDNFTRQVLLDMERIVEKLNVTWNQTLTYDKYSQEYLETCNKHEEEIDELKVRCNKLLRAMNEAVELLNKAEETQDLCNNVKAAKEKLQHEINVIEGGEL